MNRSIEYYEYRAAILRAECALTDLKYAWSSGAGKAELDEALFNAKFCVLKMRAAELRYNPYHDPLTGQFTSGGGGDLTAGGGGFGGKFFAAYSNGGAKKFTKGIDNSENSDIIKSSEDFSYVSAAGPNEFKKGFSASNLADHWVGNETIHGHKEEYPNMTMEQYAERALSLVQMPVSEKVLGHKDKSGNVIRYDKIENDFVKGNPQKGITTMFKPLSREEYYKGQKKKDEE